MQTYRKITFLFVLALILVGCQAEWTEQSLENGAIRVLSPAPFETQAAGANTTTYSTSDGRYSIVVSHSEGMANSPEDALAILKKMSIGQAKGEETHSEEVQVDGHPGLRFGMKVKEGEGTVPVEVLCLILEQKTLVQLMVSDGDADKFIKSLKVGTGS